MKKKIAALLTAALVMTMSASTVFAAVSPNWADANGTVDSSITATGVNGTVTVTAKTLDTAEETAAKAKLSEVVAGISNVSSADVQAIVELTGTVNTGEKATVTVKVSTINAGDNVIVLHYVSGAWKQETAKVENGNVVISELTEFSPFVFVKYTVTPAPTPTPTPTPAPTPAPSYDDDTETQSSPKTGVLPVAAMTAGICLAGAAVCGKKVKFN